MKQARGAEPHAYIWFMPFYLNGIVDLFWCHFIWFSDNMHNMLLTFLMIFSWEGLASTEFWSMHSGRQRNRNIYYTTNSFSCLLQFSPTTCRMHTSFLYFIGAWLRESASGPFQLYLQLWMSVNYPEPHGIRKEIFTHLERAWSLFTCFLSNTGYWSGAQKRKSVKVS